MGDNIGTLLVGLIMVAIIAYKVASVKSKAKSVNKNRPIDSELNELLEREKRIKSAGIIDGRHYTEYIGEIKQLKREKRHNEAIKLLGRLVGAVEKEARVADWGVAPRYYEELAIIYRKEKRYSDEVDILERYRKQQRAAGANPSKLDERLKKAKALKDKI